MSRNKGKGNCYKVAGERVLVGSSDLVLVHGIVVGSGGSVKGKRYGHAWVEYMHPDAPIWVVEDNSNGNSTVLPRDYYYQIAQHDPSDQERYSESQAREMVFKHRTWGPWDKRLSPE